MKECIKCQLKKDDINFKIKSYKCDECVKEYQKQYRER